MRCARRPARRNRTSSRKSHPPSPSSARALACAWTSITAGTNPSRGSAAIATDHDLRAAADAELVQDWFFIDANASVSRRNISPFGQQLIADLPGHGQCQHGAHHRHQPLPAPPLPWPGHSRAALHAQYGRQRRRPAVRTQRRAGIAAQRRAAQPGLDLERQPRRAPHAGQQAGARAHAAQQRGPALSVRQKMGGHGQRRHGKGRLYVEHRQGAGRPFLVAGRRVDAVAAHQPGLQHGQALFWQHLQPRCHAPAAPYQLATELQRKHHHPAHAVCAPGRPRRGPVARSIMARNLSQCA